jgi:hypothetical protein
MKRNHQYLLFIFAGLIALCWLTATVRYESTSARNAFLRLVAGDVDIHITYVAFEGDTTRGPLRDLPTLTYLTAAFRSAVPEQRHSRGGGAAYLTRLGLSSGGSVLVYLLFTEEGPEMLVSEPQNTWRTQDPLDFYVVKCIGQIPNNLLAALPELRSGN